MDMATKSNRTQIFKDLISKAPDYLAKALRERALISSGIRQRLTLSLLPGRIKTDWSFLPWTLSLVPTLKCSYKCRYCSHPEILKSMEENKLPHDWLTDMSVETRRKIIDDISGYKPTVSIFGGEPLEYGAIDSLLFELAEKRLFVSLTTNGGNLEAAAPSLINSGVNLIGVSFDGIGSVYDDITGCEGSFDAACRGIEKVVSLNGKNNRSNIKLIFTLCSANYKLIVPTVKEMIRFNPDQISVRHLIFNTIESVSGNSDRGFDGNVGAAFPFGGTEAAGDRMKIDGKTVIDQLKIIRKLSAQTGIPIAVEPDYTDEEIIAYYGAWEDWEMPKKTCPLPWNVMNVFPNGDAVFCGLYFYFVYGNVSHTPLKRVWNGREMKKMRRYLLNSNAHAFCRRCCALRL